MSDNAKCKFASGGANCVSHCGDPACLATSQPIAPAAEILPVVAFCDAREELLAFASAFHAGIDRCNIPLVRLADAQAQLDAQRLDYESRLKKLCDHGMGLCDQIDALKASKPNIDALAALSQPTASEAPEHIGHEAKRRAYQNGFEDGKASVGGDRRDAGRWQPIKTAPKDQMLLLGRFAPGKDRDGRQSVDFWRTMPKHDFTGWGHFNATYWPATHWMPLPPPPSAVDTVKGAE